MANEVSMECEYQSPVGRKRAGQSIMKQAALASKFFILW